MAMTVEQQENERRLNRWTQLLALMRQALTLVFAYAATKFIDSDLSFEFVFVVWVGLWVCSVAAGLVLRPWLKPHMKDCIDFDMKTKDQYIDQLERELEDEREQYLDLLGDRAKLGEELTDTKNELRKMQFAESDAESELFYTMAALDLAGITEDQVKEMRRKAEVVVGQ